MEEPTDLWERVSQAAREVENRFHPIGVVRIEAAPYEDSFGRAGVHFTVVLQDKPDGSDYQWPELSPIEKRLSDLVQDLAPDRIPYTGYLLASEARQRAAAH